MVLPNLPSFRSLRLTVAMSTFLFLFVPAKLNTLVSWIISFSCKHIQHYKVLMYKVNINGAFTLLPSSNKPATQSLSGVPSEVPCDGVTDTNLPSTGVGIECSDEVSWVSSCETYERLSSDESSIGV